MNVLDNLNAWRAVSAAARTGSVTAAAEQLGIELSKCSRLVSGMEREMGFAFFDKNTRPYRPTPQLRAFLAAFEPALRNLENARALHQATGEKMRIRFAAPIEISRLYFSKALVSYAREHPNLSFVLQPEATLAGLRAGAVDAIVLSDVPAVAEDLVVRLYHVTSTCVLATPAYLRRHGTPQTPADLVRHTGLLLRTVNLNPVRRLYRDGIESEILEWKNVFITHDQIALKELLLEDRGIAVDRCRGARVGAHRLRDAWLGACSLAHVCRHAQRTRGGLPAAETLCGGRRPQDGRRLDRLHRARPRSHCTRRHALSKRRITTALARWKKIGARSFERAPSPLHLSG